MKNLFKSLFIAILLGSAISTNAQSAIFELLSACTRIQAMIITETNTTIEFGNLPAGTPGPVYLDPTGNASNYVGSGSHQSRTTIYAQPNSSIRFEYDPYVTLQHSTETGSLNYIPEFAGNLTDNMSTAIKFPLSTGSFDVTVGENGMFYIYTGGWVGGSGTTPAYLFNQPVGEYASNFFLTLSYN